MLAVLPYARADYYAHDIIDDASREMLMLLPQCYTLGPRVAAALLPTASGAPRICLAYRVTLLRIVCLYATRHASDAVMLLIDFLRADAIFFASYFFFFFAVLTDAERYCRLPAPLIAAA